MAKHLAIYLASVALMGISLVCSQCPLVEDYPVVKGEKSILCGMAFEGKGDKDINKVYSTSIKFFLPVKMHC